MGTLPFILSSLASFLKSFYLGIIIDSQEVTPKIYRGSSVLSSQFPGIVTP